MPNLRVRADKSADSSSDEGLIKVSNVPNSKDENSDDKKTTKKGNTKSGNDHKSSNDNTQSDESINTSNGLEIVSEVQSGDDNTHTGSGSHTTKKGKKTSSSNSKNTKNHKTTSTSAQPSSTSDEEVNTSTISINPVDPPGGIQLEYPGTSIATTYIKAGNMATFEWKYTSLSITPKSLNVMAYCTMNAMTYTVTKIPAKQTKIVWDTAAWAKNNSVHFLTSMYALRIYDSHSNMSAIPRAGFLQPFSYNFGIYEPQPYVPWSGDSTYVNAALASDHKIRDRSSQIAKYVSAFVVLGALSALQ